MTIVLWIVYFATSVLGYLGMKLAAGTDHRLTFEPFFTFWGIVAMISWCVSGVVWPWILARDTLTWANAFSSLRIVLVAAAAIVFLGEAYSVRQLAGVVLVTVGVCLVR